jgi:DNA-binding Lrp family transcriptional regulator
MQKDRLALIFVPGGKKQPATIRLKSLEWAVITQMDGKQSLQKIGETLSLSSNEILEIIDHLESQQVIRPIGKDKSEVNYLKPDFFVRMEKILTALIGPVAGIIIDDVLLHLHVDRESTEVNAAGTVVEAVSAEIDNESKRLRFQQEMLQQIQNLDKVK